MRSDKTNLILLVISIVIYPIGMWGWLIPSNELYRLGLQDFKVMSEVFAWGISVISCIIIAIRYKKHQKELIFRIGAILSYLFLVIPVILVLYAYIILARATA